MKLYELNCLLKDEAAKTAEDIERYITEEGGKITKKTELEKKELGYSIGSEKSAFLVSFIFQIDKLEGLEKKLKDNAGIIRYMLLAKKEVSEKQAAKKERKKPVKAAETEEKKVELGEIDDKIDEILNE